MFNYGNKTGYGGYGYQQPPANNNSNYAQGHLQSLYGAYAANSASSNGYTQAPSSAYGYGAPSNLGAIGTNIGGPQFKPQSAENPYGFGTARMTNNVPVGFTSAGNLSSTQAALGSLFPQTAAAAAVNALSNSVAAGTHYEGYDAAVLAVTTDFINKNNPNWINQGGIHPDASFPSKKRSGLGMMRPPPRDPKAFYCDTCKISCAGPAAFKEHMAGKNHKKRQAIEAGINTINLPKNKITYRCDICELTCTGKDTYDAHVKGTRHNKTIHLMKKLGKAIPTEPTIIAPPKDVETAVQKPNKVVGVTGTKFVAGQNLSSTAKENDDKSAIEAVMEMELSILPIGEEYVDTKYDLKGKLLEYHCRLCDCSFSDPNAKAVHTKGRRHRLAYKNKVDPTIKVEMKNSVMNSRVKREKKVGNDTPKNFFNPGQHTPSQLPAHQWYDADNSMFAANQESVDDRHILAKYEEIKLDDATLESVSRLVQMIEKSLKTTSDLLKVTDFVVTKEKEAPKSVKTEDGEVVDERVLKGLMKVGLFANGLMTKSDTNVDLVVLCSKIPTKTALEIVVSLLIEHFDPSFKDRIDVSTDQDKSCFMVKAEGISVTVTVTLTCAVMREFEGKSNRIKAENELPEEHLPLAPCLKALAELRRAKWYQAKANPIEGMSVVLTVLRDIRERVGTWHPLTNYMLALFTDNVLESFGYPMTPGDALRRVFEAITSGVLLNKRATLMDPCEKEKTDVMEPLGRQEREDITSSAQHALRLIIFDQIEKILDMDRLPEGGEDEESRKRRVQEDGMEVELKKAKK